MKIASLFHLPRRLIMICLVAMTAAPVLAADEQKPSFTKEREGGFVVPLQQSPPLRPVPIGYIREMVEGLNGLMKTTDGNLAEVSQVLQAIARGDMTVRMEGDFHGVFATMRDDANATVSQLTEIVGDAVTVHREIVDLVARSLADEVMLTTFLAERGDRQRMVEAMAEAFALRPRQPVASAAR